MSIQRRKFTAEFKARVIIEMLTEQKCAAQASREYGIKDSVLSRWKQEFIERLPMLFEQGNAGSDDRDQHSAAVSVLSVPSAPQWSNPHLAH